MKLNNAGLIRTPSNARTPNERLRSIRTQLRLTRAYIGKKYALSEETLKSWENGKLTLTDKAINRCIDIYRQEGITLSKTWLLTGKGINPKRSLELSQCLSQFEEDELSNIEQEDLWILKEVEFFKNTAKNAVVLLISKEEMLPYYAPGDYIGGRLQGKTKIKECIGKDCIVITQAEEKFFRRLSINSTNNTYNLNCLNPVWGKTLEPVIYDAQIKYIAPVIWHRRTNN